MQFNVRYVLIGLGVVGASAILYLFFGLYQLNQKITQLQDELSQSALQKQLGQTPLAQTTNSAENPAECSLTCLDVIKSATASFSLKQPQKTVVQASEPVVQKASVKEYYIPFGTGSTQSNEWVDVSGTDTSIDSANYGTIAKATFEAGMHIPVANGTMYARLYNVTDKHPVWFSEVSTSAGTSTMVSSEAVTLDSGNKLYRVQIKTSLQYPSFLDFARLKIQVK